VHFVIYSLAIFITFIIEIRSCLNSVLLLSCVASGIVIVSVLRCRFRFGYEAGGMLRILICIIFHLECAQCKLDVNICRRCVPKIRGLGRNHYRNKEHRYPSAVIRRRGLCVFSILRETRCNGCICYLKRASIQIL
jgi:hypothetical protein